MGSSERAGLQSAWESRAESKEETPMRRADRHGDGLSAPRVLGSSPLPSPGLPQARLAPLHLLLRRVVVPLEALAPVGRFPAEEVAANLRRLQHLIETGYVTDTSYAVAGKFA